MARIVLSFAVLVPLALACGGGPGEEPASADPPVVVGPEDYVVVARGTVAAGPRVAGTLEAAERAVLRAETSGNVEQVSVEIGQPVAKGDLLLRIEGTVARDTLASATTGLEAARRDVEVAERELARSKRLVEAGALAEHDRELAEAQLLAARARLAEGETRVASGRDLVDATAVRAPIAGVVSERAVGAGDVVSPGSPLVTIVEPSSLRLEGSVPADAVGQLAVGTPVHFEVQGHPGRVFTGEVARVAPAVDPATRQIPVLVSIPNPEGALVAGLFAEGRVATEAQEGPVVPTDALVTGGGDGAGVSVVRVRDGKAERVAVEIGVRDDEAERVEIRTGIDAGDTVLVGAARAVEPGRAVEVRQPQGKAE
jgi:RND family efflux transporter MFP subunit